MGKAPLHSAGLAPFEALYLDLCFEKDDPCSSEAFFEAWLKHTTLSQAQKAHLRTVPRPRLALYRSLVLDNLVEVLEAILEKTRQCLGEDFVIYARKFLVQKAPSSRIFRAIANEFAVYIGQQLGPHPATSLAHYEVRRVQVAAAAQYKGPEPTELSPLRPLIFQPAVALYRSRFDIIGKLEEKLTLLLLYRTAQHDVEFLSLSEGDYALIQRLLAGEPLGSALTDSAKAEGRELDESYLSEATALLTRLGEQEVLLGGAPEPGSNAL